MMARARARARARAGHLLSLSLSALCFLAITAGAVAVAAASTAPDTTTAATSSQTLEDATLPRPVEEVVTSSSARSESPQSHTQTFVHDPSDLPPVAPRQQHVEAGAASAAETSQGNATVGQLPTALPLSGRVEPSSQKQKALDGDNYDDEDDQYEEDDEAGEEDAYEDDEDADDDEQYEDEEDEEDADYEEGAKDDPRGREQVDGDDDGEEVGSEEEEEEDDDDGENDVILNPLGDVGVGQIVDAGLEAGLERRAEVRSLSDLPLSRLLQVQSELKKLALVGKRGEEECDGKAKEQQSNRRWSSSGNLAESRRTTPPNAVVAGPNLSPQTQVQAPAQAQALNWRRSGGGASASWGSGSMSKSGGPAGGTGGASGPVRRGGGGGGGGGSWHYEEYEEEAEEGWKGKGGGGKKKGKDLGSVFHLAVTFLAFLAFGGYLLCLVIHAIKCGYGGYYYPSAAQGALRPAPNVMMVMMTPNRVQNPTRRPTRPARPGVGKRRRRRAQAAQDQGQRHDQHGREPLSTSDSLSADEHDGEHPQGWWGGGWPSWTVEDETGSRLWPHVDVDRMHRALLVVAEGYATYYHKKYVSPASARGR